jgi:hypothetical protein
VSRRQTRSIITTPPPPEPLTALAQQFDRSRAEQAALSALPELADLGDPAAARAAWEELDVLTARLTNQQPLEPEPKDTPTRPATRPSEQQLARDRTRLRTLEARLNYRASLLGLAARYHRPEWAARILGPLPTSRAGEAAWLAAAGALAAYLERWEGADPAHRPAVSTMLDSDTPTQWQWLLSNCDARRTPLASLRSGRGQRWTTPSGPSTLAVTLRCGTSPEPAMSLLPNRRVV